MSRKVRLGVNLDHVATLRQVRGGTTPYPDILGFVQSSIKAGAEQITVHLREDRRHIQERDVDLIIRKSQVPVNLEMAVTDEMIRLAKKYRPDYVCLVPEKREELTTEGGLDVVGMESRIRDLVRKLKNIKVSTFIEPSLEQVRASHRVGAVAVEFHTGKWVHLSGPQERREWVRLTEAAQLAHELGLQVHAGHGLDYKTTARLLKLPHLEEVNIGHFLVCEALKKGMESAVRKMVAVLKGKRGTR